MSVVPIDNRPETIIHNSRFYDFNTNTYHNIQVSLVKKELSNIEWATCEADGNVYGMWGKTLSKSSIGKMNITPKKTGLIDYEEFGRDLQPFQCWIIAPEGLCDGTLRVMKLPIAMNTYKYIPYYKNAIADLEYVGDTLDFNYKRFYTEDYPIFRETPTDAFNLIMKFAYYFPNYDDKIYKPLAIEASRIYQQSSKNKYRAEGMSYMGDYSFYENNLRPVINDERKESIHSVFKPSTSKDITRERRRVDMLFQGIKGFDIYKTPAERESIINRLKVIHTCLSIYAITDNFYISITYNTGRKDAKDSSFALKTFTNDSFTQLCETSFTQKGTIEVMWGYAKIIRRVSPKQ